MHHTEYNPRSWLPPGDTFVFNRKLYKVIYRDANITENQCLACGLYKLSCVGTPSCHREDYFGNQEECTFQETTEDPYTLLRLKGEL